MLLKSVVNVLDEIAPPGLAESWDNVGLLVGDPSQAVSSAILCIDYTDAVADKARTLGCDLVIAYHPPIFEAIKRVTADGNASRIFDAIRRGVAIYSPHTALDVAPCGTNDLLADVIALQNRRPLKFSDAKPTLNKLVTFVPTESFERVRAAVFAADAGSLGNYTACGFSMPGEGTFKGNANSNPAIGQPGTMETVSEIRFETIVPIARTEAVLAALRSSHPYEEVAFDLYPLTPEKPKLGIGRVGELDPIDRGELIAKVKSGLELEHVLIAGPTTGDARSAAVCAGACGKLLDDAIAAKVDVYITGEMRHHDALKAAAVGMTVICTLHSNSERAILKRLAERLRQTFPNLSVHLSANDVDPFSIR